MATYTVDIPAVAPLASGIMETVVGAAINAGDELNENHVTVARQQHKHRKRLQDATNIDGIAGNVITAAEVTASKLRKHKVASANFDGPTPLWAQQMQQQMQQGTDVLGRRLQRFDEISRNRSRRSTTAPIVPLINVATGAYPPENIFPQDQNALMTATGATINALLVFYGEPTNGTVPEKRERLKSFLGVDL